MTLASLIFPLIKPIFNRIDAETAHRWTIAMLKSQANARQPAPSNLAIDCWGLSFPNPLGVAAGFDKNADVPDALLGLGFGFVEVGTVTPRPQAGNPRPRLFRLAEDEAVINRMGFNNLGSGIVRRHLDARRDKRGMVGVSIGANKNSADWISDFSGSLPFLFIHCGLFFVWIILNTGPLARTPLGGWDEFPYGLLTMCVSLEAIILSVFVLLSQNRQVARDRVRNDIEYEVNLKAELEIAHLHEKFDHLHAELLDRLSTLEKSARIQAKTPTQSRVG